MESISEISIALAEFFSVLLFIFSLVYCFRRGSALYMKLFPVFCFVNCPLGEAVVSMATTKKWFWLFFSVLELLFYTFVLTSLLDDEKVKKVVWILAFISVGVFALSFFANDYVPGVVGLAYEAFVLVIPCLGYLSQLFSKQSNVDIADEPGFWITIGILFYFALLIPTLLVTKYFWAFHLGGLSKAIYSVNNYALIIAYVLYMKAMTCRIRESY